MSKHGEGKVQEIDMVKASVDGLWATSVEKWDYEGNPVGSEGTSVASNGRTKRPGEFSK